MEAGLKGLDYLEAYRRHTDERIAQDPKRGIGGRWEEIGRLQLDFLKEYGFGKRSTILDFGCGTGRFAEQLLDWFEGDYVGCDISEMARIKIGLLLDGPHRFTWDITHVPPPHRYDFVWAHSVFTHLPPDLFQGTLQRLVGNMSEYTQLFFTYHPSETEAQSNHTNFRYPFESILMMAPDSLVLKEVPYDHPRGQRMIMGLLR